MGKTRYSSAKEALLSCRKEIGSPVKLEVLKNFIRIHCGSDEKRSVIPYLELMRDMKMIRETMQGWEILIENENRNTEEPDKA